jgi:hypothetical protein
MYITNLLNVKNLIQNNGFLSSKHKNIFKYINYFYNIVKNYASILKKNMDLILSKKSLKSKKIFHIKANFFITVFDSNIQQPIGNDVSISTTTKFYTKAINHILTLSSFYYILKIKIIKLRALKRNNSLINIINSINFKKEIIRYFKDVKLNILLLTNLNIIFKNIININHHYLLYFIKNLLIKNVSLDINFLHTKLDSTYKIIKNEFTNNIIEFNDKNLIFSKSKKKLVHKYKYFKTNSKNIFLSNNVKKNYIHFYKYKLINNLLFNYINNNNIISYKSKIIFFNLNKSNSFLNMKSK